jgi:hypothetical protein
LLGRRGGGKKRGASELVFEEGDVAAAKDSGGGVQEDVFDFLFEYGIPAFAEEFDLGEFRHGRREEDLMWNSGKLERMREVNRRERSWRLVLCVLCSVI